MRHAIIEFDYVNNDGVRFIQYGRSPVKWVLFKKKDKKCPMFLSASGWKITHQKFGFMTGTTKKPLKFEKQWGASNEKALRNERHRPGREPVIGYDK